MQQKDLKEFLKISSHDEKIVYNNTVDCFLRYKLFFTGNGDINGKKHQIKNQMGCYLNIYPSSCSSCGFFDCQLYWERRNEYYPLSEDLEKEIVTPYGKNVIVIKDGHAQITFADCPDGICSSHRPIKKNGENIICLPPKLVVVISGEGDK